LTYLDVTSKWYEKEDNHGIKHVARYVAGLFLLLHVGNSSAAATKNYFLLGLEMNNFYFSLYMYNIQNYLTSILIVI